MLSSCIHSVRQKRTSNRADICTWLSSDFSVMGWSLGPRRWCVQTGLSGPTLPITQPTSPRFEPCQVRQSRSCAAPSHGQLQCCISTAVRLTTWLMADLTCRFEHAAYLAHFGPQPVIPPLSFPFPSFFHPLTSFSPAQAQPSLPSFSTACFLALSLLRQSSRATLRLTSIILFFRSR